MTISINLLQPSVVEAKTNVKEKLKGMENMDVSKEMVEVEMAKYVMENKK